MFRLVVVAAAFGIAFWLARRARHATASSRAIAWFAGAALANHWLIEAWKLQALVPVRPLLIVAAALAGFAAWAAIVWLTHLEPRRRDPWFRYPLFFVAAITAIADAPWGVSAGFTIAATLCYRWKDCYPTVTLFRLGLGAIALSLLLLLQLPRPGYDVPAGTPLDALEQFSRWSMYVALFHALAGVVALFAGFVRDPTLGIRRVGRRLALSHLLVVLVPLALTVLLWAVTTIVGVGSERARVAARVMEDHAHELQQGMRAALDLGDEAPAALRRLAMSRGDSAHGARAWSYERGRRTRVLGAPLRGDSLLSAWFAAADTVPRAGFLGFAGEYWIAALAGDPAARAALVLLPAYPIADSVDARHVGGEIFLLGNVGEGDVVIAAGDARAPQRPRVQIQLPTDTIEANPYPDDTTRGAFIPSGQTLSRGAMLRNGAWRRAPFVVAVTISPRQVLGELFTRARENEIDIVPVVFVLFFAVLFALVAAFDFVMVINMGRNIAGAIGALRTGAQRLEAGDLAHRIPVRGDDDLWGVAGAFNQAAGGLERARELEKERDRLESELALARRIQSRLLPAMAPDVAGWEIAGASESARQVGGDYYDHIDLGGGRMVLVIADVSGKGVPAALLMSAFRAALVSQDLSEPEPSRLAGRLNGFLHQSVEPGRFVTAFVAFLDTASGRLVYVNAGHNPPYIVRADGRDEELSEGGTILGILAESPFTSGETTLAPGDTLALYTDGVTEGANAAGEMWGEARLLEALREGRTTPVPDLVRQLVDTVRAFEGDQGPADDITLLLARRAGFES